MNDLANNEKAPQVSAPSEPERNQLVGTTTFDHQPRSQLARKLSPAPVPTVHASRMLHATRSPGRSRRISRVLLVFPLLTVLLASWACGASLTTTHAVGSALALYVGFSNQFSQDGPMVQVEVLVSDPQIRGPTVLDSRARLTCEGADVAPDYQNYFKPCPRQPAGGVYHFVYTDEHGHTATAEVPIPTGRLALLDPHEGSTIHAPTATGILPIHYAAPVVPKGGSVELHDITAGCRKSGNEITGYAGGAPVSVGTGGPGVYKLAGSFNEFTSGTGWVSLKTTAVVVVQPGGFRAVTAKFEDFAQVAVTWTT